jgi:hypothetical protein
MITSKSLLLPTSHLSLDLDRTMLTV